MTEQRVSIHSEYITLDAFLKWAGVADTGGHAKALIVSGNVFVNSQVERRRGRKLRSGDRIKVMGAGHWLIADSEGDG